MPRSGVTFVGSAVKVDPKLVKEKRVASPDGDVLLEIRAPL